MITANWPVKAWFFYYKLNAKGNHSVDCGIDHEYWN